jgi:hypothetical protein
MSKPTAGCSANGRRKEEEEEPIVVYIRFTS